MKVTMQGSGLLFLCFLFLSWTNTPLLRVRTEPLYPGYLSSQRIDTVDPFNKCFFGEQIVVYYRFPQRSLSDQKLILTIRYKDHSYETLVFSLCKQRGYWIYRLINENYGAHGGILSYKVELYQNDEMIQMWKHHLYVDLIEIPHTSDEPLVTLTDTIPKN